MIVTVTWINKYQPFKQGEEIFKYHHEVGSIISTEISWTFPSEIALALYFALFQNFSDNKVYLLIQRKRANMFFHSLVSFKIRQKKRKIINTYQFLTYLVPYAGGLLTYSWTSHSKTTCHHFSSLCEKKYPVKSEKLESLFLIYHIT